MMMDDKGETVSRVTVIMPVYNGGKYIKDAIQSILDQTYPDFTLLCIDDCSTDESLDIIRTFHDDRIQIIQNKSNRGIAYTRNRGLDLAETEYIALLDNDDVAMPYRLEHEVEFLDANLEIQVVGGHQRQIDGEGKDLNKQWSVYLNPAYIAAYLLLNNTIANGTTMFRKAFIEKHKIRYKDNMYGTEDYEFWVQCSLKGRIQNLDEVFLLWRVAGQNETFYRMNQFETVRKEALYKIRNHALTAIGINLTHEKLLLLGRVFYDDGVVDNLEDLEMLYRVLKEISDQALILNLDHSREIITMCRKRFGEKVGKAFFLWE